MENLKTNHNWLDDCPTKQEDVTNPNADAFWWQCVKSRSMTSFMTEYNHPKTITLFFLHGHAGVFWWEERGERDRRWERDRGTDHWHADLLCKRYYNCRLKTRINSRNFREVTFQQKKENMSGKDALSRQPNNPSLGRHLLQRFLPLRFGQAAERQLQAFLGRARRARAAPRGDLRGLASKAPRLQGSKYSAAWRLERTSCVFWFYDLMICNRFHLQFNISMLHPPRSRPSS